MGKRKLYSFEHENPANGHTLVYYFYGEFPVGKDDAKEAAALAETNPLKAIAMATIVLDATDNTFVKCRVPFEDLLNSAYDVESIG